MPQFSENRNLLELNSKRLQQPLPSSDEETHQKCLEVIYEICGQIERGLPFSQRVKDVLSGSISHKTTANMVAVALRCSKRTLNRRLSAEGLTFADLATETRIEAITRQLAASDLSPKEISYNVGFEDIRSLRRFFKRHTGLTLSEYRHKIQSDIHNPSGVLKNGQR